MIVRPSAATTPRDRSLFTDTKDRLTDLIGGGTTEDKIEIDLSGEEYKNITDRQAGQMLGYFTQKMKDLGFPWRLKTAEDVKGVQKMRGAISELEAMDRLKKGQPVFLEPMRNLNLSINADSLGALAAAGTLGGATALDGVSKVAAFAKDGKVGANNGVELKHGAPILVSSYAELKLVFQMYNPDDKVSEKNPVAKSAHQLSSFTKKMGTSYPWRFYKKADDNTLMRVARSSARAGFSGALVGAALGTMIGGPIGLFTGNWSILKIMATYGGMIGGGYAALDAGRVAAKGEPINVVEALERINQGQEVVLQETVMRSVTVPFLGNVAWFTDRGKGSSVASPGTLDQLYWMLNPDKQEEKKEDPRPPADNKKVQVIVQPGGTLHMHVGDDIQVGDKLHLGDSLSVESSQHTHLDGEIKVNNHAHLKGARVTVHEEHTHFEGGVKVQQDQHTHYSLKNSPVTVETSEQHDHVHLGEIPGKKPA